MQALLIKVVKIIVTIFCSLIILGGILIIADVPANKTNDNVTVSDNNATAVDNKKNSTGTNIIITLILGVLPIYLMWFRKRNSKRNNTALQPPSKIFNMPREFVLDITNSFDNEDINVIINKFQNYLSTDTNINESVDSKVSKIIKALLIHELKEKPLSQEIEDKIYQFMEHFNTKSDDLDLQTKELIVKGCIVRDLLAGNPNPKVQVPDMPFNLKKDEKLIYAFQIPVKEVVTKKERIAGSKGVSIRVMKGVYYHMGGSKGQTIETKVNQSLGICSVAVTNQYIYIMSAETSFRIAFNKIVSIYNNGDSIIIYRDGAKNNPLMLEYNDTWFLYNILQNATNW